MSLSGLFFALAGFGAAGLLGKLRDYRAGRQRSLVDFLPWAFLVASHPQGVVVNKDGSFTAAFELRGPDRSSSTDSELNTMTHQVSRALAGFVNSWTFHFNQVRRPAPDYPPVGDFPDPLTRYLDECRRQSYLRHGALYESVTVLSVTFRPPREVYQHALLRLQQGVEQERKTWCNTLDSFLGQLEVLRSRLSGSLRVRPLEGEELLAHFHACLTGLHHPVRDPGAGVYLDQVLASQHATAGWEPAVGALHFAIVALSHLPGRISPADLDALNDIGFPFRLSVRFTLLDTRASQAVIDRYTQGWFWMQRSAADLLIPSSEKADKDKELLRSRHAVHMLDDAADASQLNAAGEHRFAYFTANLIVPGATRQEANQHALELTKFLSDRGYTTRTETYNSPAALHGSLPGQAAANLRSPLVNCLCIADMLPLTTLWPGLLHNTCQFYPPKSPPILIGRTEGTTPFRLHLHTAGDLGHTLVVGPPGGGKSTHLAALASGFLRYPGSRVFLFDRDRSARLFAGAARARYYDLGNEQIRFQPLRDVDDEADRARVLSWLDALFSLQLGRSVTPQQRTVLATALLTVAKSPLQHRTLRLLATQLQDPDLRAAIEPFVRDGAYSSLLDGSEDALSEGRLQMFEMRRLLDLEERVHLPVLYHLLDRIERSLDGSPTLIILDEAGIALLHPVFASRINQWALTLRKRNAVLVLALQALSQLESNGSFSTLLQSCPTRIYLPNPDATSPGIRRVYESCGLNETQIELIARLTSKRDYYFTSPAGSRLYGLALTPADLAFYSTLPGRSLQETNHAMDQHARENGPRWPVAWLRTCGLPDEAAALNRTYEEMNP